MPRSVRPHNPPSADARPPRGVLGLFVCPLPWLPAAESPRILPAWEARPRLFHRLPTPFGVGGGCRHGARDILGTRAAWQCGEHPRMLGNRDAGGPAGGGTQQRVHEGGCGFAPSAAPSHLHRPLPHAGVPPAPHAAAPSLPGAGPFGEASVDAGEMRQSLGNGGGQSGVTSGARPFVTSRLQPYASPAAGKAGGVSCPAACPPRAPSPGGGQSRSCSASPSPAPCCPPITGGAAVKGSQAGPLHPQGDLGVQNEARPPALRLRPAPRCRQHAQRTLLPRGGMWGQPPLHQGRGVSGLGTSRLPAGTASPPALPLTQTDGWTDGRTWGRRHPARKQVPVLLTRL